MSQPIINESINETGPEARPGLDPALERVLTRFRLRARRRAVWLRKLWKEEGEPMGKMAITHGEIDTHLEGHDRWESEAAWIASDGKIAALNHELAQLEEKMAADNDSCLSQLRRIFNLDQPEFDLFQACLALSFDPSLRRVCAYLQDHSSQAYMNEELAARLFGYVGRSLWNSQSPLKRWELIHEVEVGPGEPKLLACDPQIRGWLLGEHYLDPLLVGIAERCSPLQPLNNWPIAETAAFIKNAPANNTAEGVRVRLVGLAGTGRRTLAADISSRVGLPLLVIDSDRIEEPLWTRVFTRVQRQAFLDRYALAWYGERAETLPWPRTIRLFPVQFLISEKHRESESVPGLIDYKVEMPVPSLDERKALWRTMVPAAKLWTEPELNGLVERHSLTLGQISMVARRDVKSADEAVKLAREAGRYRLGKLALLLDCPFTWDDLVLTDQLKQTLSDILFEAKNRVRFWERPAARRLYPQGRGLLALFSGPPGTGKTMAAQVIAASLGLDLFRIDLSSVVSKYVGETSQNLENILSRAIHMDVVLLFDEADALFGKRTEIKDAHDRFANTDTGYLLQAIENYQGIALLATNKKGNIDPGFIRRIRYVLEFPRPDAVQRFNIWERIIGELAGKESLQGITDDLKRVARGVDITGAQIKFAVLAALFAAQKDGGQLAMRHILRGLDYEFAKEGRALSDRDRASLLGNG